MAKEQEAEGYGGEKRSSIPFQPQLAGVLDGKSTPRPPLLYKRRTTRRLKRPPNRHLLHATEGPRTNFSRLFLLMRREIFAFTRRRTPD